jgi:hypothetical protein
MVSNTQNYWASGLRLSFEILILENTIVLQFHSVRAAPQFFGPLSLVSTIEEQLRRKSSSSGLESREYSRGDPLR